MTRREERDRRIIAEVTVKFMEAENKRLADLYAAACKENMDLCASKQALLNSVCYHMHRADDAEAKLANYGPVRGEGGKFVKTDGTYTPKTKPAGL